MTMTIKEAKKLQEIKNRNRIKTLRRTQELEVKSRIFTFVCLVIAMTMLVFKPLPDAEIVTRESGTHFYYYIEDNLVHSEEKAIKGLSDELIEANKL